MGSRGLGINNFMENHPVEGPFIKTEYRMRRSSESVIKSVLDMSSSGESSKWKCPVTNWIYKSCL